MWLAILIGISIAVSWATLPSDLALPLTIVSILLGGITLYQGWKMDRRVEEGNRRFEAMQKETQRIIDEGNKRLEAMLKETQKMIEEGNIRTQKMIEEGNIRTQKLIEEGNARTERLIAEIHKSTLETLERMEKRAEERHREIVFK